jgi:cellulose synthase/poly-beta-1,6-N-acetylglucosamine synthase-like glycosyltransferase
MLSVIIAAYQTKGLIEENLKKLRNFGNFEIIIAADEPDEELLNLIKEKGLKASISSQRRGKWRALNDAVKLASSPYILFLDSDTLIEELPENYAEFDAVEIRKEVFHDGFWSWLVNIDYMNMYMAAKLAEKLKGCLGLNGAAFIVRRDVIQELGGFNSTVTEDAELGVRIAFNGYRFGTGGKALTKAPDFAGWLKQRKRWAAGGAEIVLNYFWNFLRKPLLTLPALILIFPALIGLIINLILPDNLGLKLAYLLVPLIYFLPTTFSTVILIAIHHLYSLQNFVQLVFTFLAWCIFMALAAKKLRWGVNLTMLLIMLPLYFLVYSPLWTMLSLTTFLRVLVMRLIGRRYVPEDWAV